MKTFEKFKNDLERFQFIKYDAMDANRCSTSLPAVTRLTVYRRCQVERVIRRQFQLVGTRTETDANVIFCHAFWFFSKVTRSFGFSLIFHNTLKYFGAIGDIRFQFCRQSSEICWRIGRSSDVKKCKKWQISKIHQINMWDQFRAARASYMPTCNTQ